MNTHKKGRPPGRYPENRPIPNAAKSAAKRTKAVLSITHRQDDPAASDAMARCTWCGHDPVVILTDLIAERHDAWLAGVLEGFADGWHSGEVAGLERGRAA